MGLGGRHALREFLADRFFRLPAFFLIRDLAGLWPGAAVAEVSVLSTIM